MVTSLSGQQGHSVATTTNKMIIHLTCDEETAECGCDGIPNERIASCGRVFIATRQIVNADEIDD